MKRKNNPFIFFLFSLLFCLGLSQASTRYLLCGSDEDGCYDYRSCACIPYNEFEANNRFCLDLDTPRCIPLSEAPNCYVLFIHKNQQECLATLYQSKPHPSCLLVSGSLCLENHIALCNADGNFNTCVQLCL